MQFHLQITFSVKCAPLSEDVVQQSICSMLPVCRHHLAKCFGPKRSRQVLFATNKYVC